VTPVVAIAWNAQKITIVPIPIHVLQMNIANQTHASVIQSLVELNADQLAVWVPRHIALLKIPQHAEHAETMTIASVATPIHALRIHATQWLHIPASIRQSLAELNADQLAVWVRTHIAAMVHARVWSLSVLAVLPDHPGTPNAVVVIAVGGYQCVCCSPFMWRTWRYVRGIKSRMLQRPLVQWDFHENVRSMHNLW
jgi:RNase H-fold protein (predicted Holliday junction resolvase)